MPNRSRAKGRVNLTAQLPSLTTPTLLIWGEDDTTSPVRVGEALSCLILGSELVTIAKAGHLVAEERPAEVASLVGAFFERT